MSRQGYWYGMITYTAILGKHIKLVFNSYYIEHSLYYIQHSPII